MKKRLFAILAVILCFLMGSSVMAGCNLVTVNNERDMNQTVATVQISDDAPKQEIKKKEIMLAYMNYGYYYVQTGQYTAKQVVEMIMDNLVSARIILQNAITSFDADPNYSPKKDGVDKWSAQRYLTETQMIDAKYQAAKAFNDLVLGYIDEEEPNLKGDTSTEEIRTVPTGATNAEEKLSDTEKAEYVNKYPETNGVDTGSTAEIKSAYNKVLKLLENNGLLGDYNKNKSVLQTSYYKDSLRNAEEGLLLDAYEEEIKLQERESVSIAALEQKYAEMYNAQQSGYDSSEADYSSALSSATNAKPVVYHPYTGYGYVYNLLLGATDAQKADITDLTKDNTTDSYAYAQARKAILDKTKVKDLRSTWITNGYDFDYATKKFTGDYAFLENSLEFQGDVTLLKEKSTHNGHDHPAEYRIDRINEFALAEFVSVMDNYLYGTNVADTKDTNVVPNVHAPSVYKVFNAQGTGVDLTDFDDKINELMFAFSTDPGSLNSYKGYTISPKPEAGESETYMKEFAQAGRYVIGLSQGSYVIVATDYGYHVMIYSQILGANTSYDNLGDYLSSLGIDLQSEYNTIIDQGEDYEDTDSYLYQLLSLCSNESNIISEYRTATVRKYQYGKLSNGNKCVVKYESTYADLLKE